MDFDKDIYSYSITVKNKLTELPFIVEAVGVLAVKWGLSAKFVHQINLALEEVVSNIIFYAYSDSNEHEIQIVFLLLSEQILVKVIDDGKCFNMLETVIHVDTEAGVEDRRIGGLGIHILKQMVDDIAYERKNNKNELKLTKQL